MLFVNFVVEKNLIRRVRKHSTSLSVPARFGLHPVETVNSRLRARVELERLARIDYSRYLKMKQNLKAIGVVSSILILGVCFCASKLYFDFPAFKYSVLRLNQLIGTTISERNIHYKATGFVDTNAFAAVPMKQHEFDATILQLGLHKGTGQINDQNHKPYWWEPPSEQHIYESYNLNIREHTDYIQCHYNGHREIAYFYYYDT